MSAVAAAITVGAAATLGGSYLAAEGAKDASKSQLKADKLALVMQEEAAKQARGDVKEATRSAGAQLRIGTGEAQRQIELDQARQTGLLRDTEATQRQAITSGYGAGIDTLRGAQASGLQRVASGMGQARQDVDQGITSGLGEVAQFADVGEQALQQEAAMSGALGPEAQAQAMQAYSESPGQKYLREQQEQALLRNSAAIGGLGGGNVRTALQEQAFGIASTDQQRYLENLRNLASRGQTAATTQAGIQTQGASSLANIAAQQGLTEAQLIQQLQSSIAGQQVGQGQLQSDIAGQAGTNIANIIGADKANLANLFAQRGAGLAGIQTGMGQTLANIAVGAGSNQAQITQDMGAARAAGQLGVANAWNQGLQGLTGLAGTAAGIYGGV